MGEHKKPCAFNISGFYFNLKQEKRRLEGEGPAFVKKHRVCPYSTPPLLFQMHLLFKDSNL